jgi:hypothetical protein
MDNYSEIGVGATELTIELPDIIPLTDPDYPVVLEFWQELCGVPGPTLKVPVIAMPAAHAPPQILEPVYDCTWGLRLRGANPGALVQAFDVSTMMPLSALTPVPMADFVLMCWFPMLAERKVFVRQQGCNASGDSNGAVVKPLPAQLPQPDLKTPRPGNTKVQLSKVLPGATVQLVVSGQPRSPSIVLWDDPAEMPVFGPALSDGDDVLPVQTLCAAYSQHEGRGVVVARGHMKVGHTPNSVTTDTTTNVRVNAIDAVTNDTVLASVSINGKQVGMTGMPFPFSPKGGDPAPAGVVSEPIGYFDEPFTIPLVAPTPPTTPQWSITFHASPKLAFLGTATVEISLAHFDIVADWDPTLKRGITASPVGSTTPEIDGTTSLPPPAGSVMTATVTAWLDWKMAAGVYNGVQLNDSTGSSNKMTFKIKHNAVAHNAYLVWGPVYVQDPASGNVWFSIELRLGSISP